MMDRDLYVKQGSCSNKEVQFHYIPGSIELNFQDFVYLTVAIEDSMKKRKSLGHDDQTRNRMIFNNFINILLTSIYNKC